MNELDAIKALVLRVAEQLVDEPDQVKIEITEDGDAATIRLRVSPNDLGKIIGKQGRTARSIRTILSAASMKSKLKVSLNIAEHSS